MRNHLLMFSRRFHPDVFSGTETVFYHLHRHLARSFQTDMVCGWYRDPALLPTGARSVKLAGLRKEVAYFTLHRFCKSQIADLKPSVILSNSIEIPVGRTPTILVFHDVNFGSVRRGILDVLKEKYYSLKCRRFTRIAAVSQVSADALVQLGVDPSIITVIPNGIDTTVYTPLEHDTGSLPAILVPGRIVPGKGQHIALQAFRRLFESGTSGNFRMQIVGRAQDYPYLAQLQQLALGLPVDILTNVDDIVPFYQNCRMVLFPTLLKEGFGYAAIEGMACGKPVIFAEDAAVNEATGGVGISTRRGSVEELASAMSRLILDRDRAKQLGSQGLAWVRQNYSWEKTAGLYAQLIRSITRPDVS